MTPYEDTTLSALLQEALQSAMREHIPTDKIKLLLSAITGLTLPEVMVKKDHFMTDDKVERFWHWFGRLKAHEPLQYITGKAPFYGLMLSVNKGVLIPRPETEGLVEWLCVREKGALRILDIGTGSGAIALAIKNLKPGSHITATDISAEALGVAQKNANSLKLDITFIGTDLFPENASRFDIIVSNPPYVSLAEYEKLDEEIRLFEPKIALLAEEDGLQFYRLILQKAQSFLTETGKVYLEIGELQARTVSRIAVNAGFRQVEVKRDLAGRNRYLCASL
jgi:release factor glutamine methyltransferase